MLDDDPDIEATLVACVCAASTGRYSYPRGRDLTELAKLVHASDFRHPALRRVWEEVVQRHTSGDPYDLLTLHAAFTSNGAFTGPHGKELAAIMRELVTADQTISDGTEHPQRVRAIAAAVVAEAHRRAASVDMSAAIAGHPPRDWLTVWRDHGTRLAETAERLERLLTVPSTRKLEAA